ncbi:hypothetical protein GCM10020331_066890 [Ectobacillus funiculus]
MQKWEKVFRGMDTWSIYVLTSYPEFEKNGTELKLPKKESCLTDLFEQTIINILVRDRHVRNCNR